MRHGNFKGVIEKRRESFLQFKSTISLRFHKTEVELRIFLVASAATCKSRNSIHVRKHKTWHEQATGEQCNQLLAPITYMHISANASKRGHVQIRNQTRVQALLKMSIGSFQLLRRSQGSSLEDCPWPDTLQPSPRPWADLLLALPLSLPSSLLLLCVSGLPCSSSSPHTEPSFSPVVPDSNQWWHYDKAEAYLKSSSEFKPHSKWFAN